MLLLLLMYILVFIYAYSKKFDRFELHRRRSSLRVDDTAAARGYHRSPRHRMIVCL